MDRRRQICRVVSCYQARDTVLNARPDSRRPRSRHRRSTRLSAAGVADEWVTQLLGQTDAKVLKK